MPKPSRKRKRPQDGISSPIKAAYAFRSISAARLLRCFVVGWLSISVLLATEYRGEVTFNGLPVPGAAVMARHGGKILLRITNRNGIYSFHDLAEGEWSVQVEMAGFATVKQDVAITTKMPVAHWELKLLPLTQVKAARPVQELEQTTPNALLINGSVNNGASSPFAQAPVFGNHRPGGRGLYNGGIGMILGNSALDAQPFSLTGQRTPKPSYNDLTGLATIGGPLRIPHLLRNGPNVFAAYQWTRDRDSTIDSALMPTTAERNSIPPSVISPQALALLRYYPLPNFDGGSRYNYQVPIVSPAHQDALQSRFNQRIGNKDQIYGGFGFLSTRTDAPNLFDFTDTTDLLGMKASIHWSHRLNRGLFLNLGYQFSRFATRVKPYFADRENVSGDAGITGNDQSPVNWGPPSLTFAGGIAGLADGLPKFDRNQTGAVSYSMLWQHGGHNFQFGGSFRREEFNYLSQQDPRGSFLFSDFTNFLLGVPDTSSIAFGNADKYFRESVYDAYFNDDWRISPDFTLNAGLRWEYGAPITELYNRLVNLDIVPGFSAVAPVLASDPIGPLTGRRYPNSLLRPDKAGFEPRVGIAWRPLPASSLIVRAGYGVYDNTSVYQTIYTQLAQQPPLSKTLSVQNSPGNPLTLADGFKASPSITPNTFAIDPNFRVGYAQEWRLSVQRDLPGSLQLLVSYLGIKGTRGLQEFLPNTYPIGTVNPCPACPAGYVYLASNGNSTREAGSIELRRRLHSGFTATVTYTFAKAIDDDASLGGQGALLSSQPTQGANTQNAIQISAPPTASSAIVAQNWLNLSAERSLSSFDQRHLLSLQMQYTTGMGLAGGTLLSGWRGALFKEWTFATEITAGSGLPETPIYLAAVQGTGVTGTIRPDYTGAPLYAAPAGFSLNPEAYDPPAPGQWGNAGRNSITGPVQFTLNASAGRTFRVGDHLHLDLRVDATNALNHVTYTAWNTTINNAQFGLPVSADAMRSIRTTLRLRF
ncbi:MAG TPA: carboxypeptidase regulatory-like domain-containing protein [Bryobacteraceae bacterium]